MKAKPKRDPLLFFLTRRAGLPDAVFIIAYSSRDRARKWAGPDQDMIRLTPAMVRRVLKGRPEVDPDQLDRLMDLNRIGKMACGVISRFPHPEDAPLDKLTGVRRKSKPKPKPEPRAMDQREADLAARLIELAGELREVCLEFDTASRVDELFPGIGAVSLVQQAGRIAEFKIKETPVTVTKYTLTCDN